MLGWPEHTHRQTHMALLPLPTLAAAPCVRGGVVKAPICGEGLEASASSSVSLSLPSSSPASGDSAKNRSAETRKLTDTRKCALCRKVFMHTCTHTYTHTQTHAHTHTHTHTHTCTYVHTPRTLSWTQRPRRWVTGTWKRRPRVGCCLPTPCIVASAGSTYIAPCGVRKCMRTKKVSLRCRCLYDMLIRSLHS